MAHHRLCSSHYCQSCVLGSGCNGVQREHNKKLNNGLPILHKVPPKHNFDSNGYCTACGVPHIVSTVTVELGNAANATATISAENVTLPTYKTLKVTVNDPFTATLVGTTDVTAHYTIKNGDTSFESGDPVLTAKNGESPKIPLTFVKPDAAPYAGSYTGTVTFEVSVG